MILLPFGKPQDLVAALPQVRLCLAHAGVVLLPTETFYGLAADPYSQEAVDTVLELKGRPHDMPFLVLAANWDQINQLAVVPEFCRPRLEFLWPGPITAVLPARSALPASPGGTVALRIPGHLMLRKLLNETGPLTGTSANFHGQRPSVDVDRALESLAGKPALALDGGPAPGGRPSTLVDLSGEQVRILRQGALSWVDG